MSTPDPQRDLILEFLERRRRGERLSAEDFATQHPGAGPELVPLLEEALRELEEDATLRQAPPAGAEAPQGSGDDPTLRQSPDPDAVHDTLRTPAEGEETRPAPGAAGAAPAKVIDGRYEVAQLLGQGGFGKVYLVRDRFYQGERRALKTILPRYSSQPEFERRFQNEIRVLRALSHKGIPQIYNDGRTAEGGFYYTMAFVEGVTLSDVIKKEAPLEPDRIVRLVRQMLGILEYAHAKGVVHRDLKPANVMLLKAGTPDEDVRILDFGIAKVLRPEGELEGAQTMNTMGGIGTPHYMSPEQIRGQDVDGRTDVYALGIIIYQMCSGLLPFTGKTDLEVATARLERPPTPLKAEQTPPHLRTLVMRLLERQRENRPDTREVGELLGGVEAVPEGSSKKRRLVVGALAVALLASIALALATAWVLWGRTPRRPASGAVASGVEPGSGAASGSELDPGAGASSASGIDPGSGAPAASGIDPGAGAASASSAAVAPRLVVLEPAPDTFVGSGPIEVTGVASGHSRLEVGGELVAVGANGDFHARVPLPQRDGAMALVIRDADSGEELFRRDVVVDRSPPTIECAPPGRAGPGGERYLAAGHLPATLSGRIMDAAPGELDPDSIELDGEPLELTPDGRFSHELAPVPDGELSVTITARDRAGNAGRPLELRWVVDTRAPVIVPDPALPSSTSEAEITLRARVEDAHPHVLLWRRDAWIEDDRVQSTTLGREGSFQQLMGLDPGPNRWFLLAEDAAGNRSQPVQVLITRGEPLAPAPLVPAGFSAAPGSPVDEAGRVLRVVHDATGLTLVLVPAGSASLSGGRKSFTDFYVGETEVTWAEFHRFRADFGTAEAEHPDFPFDESHPVVRVTFEEARDFCRWAGMRLPTRSEWEYAARGPGGLEYPWGNTWEAGACNGLLDSGDSHPRTAPAGSFPRDESWCLALDMAGNVHEWCTQEPGGEAVLSGGAWSSFEAGCKLSRVGKPRAERADDVGFRVCFRPE